jgi:hypothetical protein
VGSVGANITEGYSRGTGQDRARFYEYSLGSARESSNWYFDARHLLTQRVATHRLRLLAEITRLLLTMIPNQRGKYLHEDPVEYRVEVSETVATRSSTELDTLLSEVPYD